MALSIATNTGALMAAASATSVNKDLETSMERLSTGKRINSASDDAAGVAIASRLTSEIKGTNQAIRNAQDGQALIDTAEGAHKEVETILQRMRELAVQSSNDTNDTSDRANLQAEFSALATEINRIAGATTWAGQDLLTGAGGTDGDGAFNIQVGGNTGTVDTITVTIGGMTTSDLGEGDTKAGAFTTVGTTAATQVSTVDGSDFEVAEGDVFTLEVGDVTLTYTATASDSDMADVTAGLITDSDYADSGFTLAQASNVITATYAAVGVQTQTMSLSENVFDISDRDQATAMIDMMDDAIATVNTQRAELGATSNRLDNTVNNLTSISIQLEGGRGRIEDADFAAESTSLAKSQILQQASTAMLAQANASKQSVLSLLQG
jgi:flagellin